MCKTPALKGEKIVESLTAAAAAKAGPMDVRAKKPYEHAHHCIALAATLYVVFQGPAGWPSLKMCLWWLFYSDAYSAVLHCTLDDKRCLPIPGVGPVARGFQDHHDHPIASTMGKGLYTLLCDTVRIQWLCMSGAVLFGRWNYDTFLLTICKMLFTAYGTQVGHYYAHCGCHAPAPVRVLQRMHILLPPSAHWEHHKAPYSKNFGIVNGLSNYFLNYPLRELYCFELCAAVWAFLTFFDVALMERVTSAL